MARFVLLICGRGTAHYLCCGKDCAVEKRRSVMEEKLMELCELASNEQDPQKLRVLILQISVLLEAKEQRLRDKSLNAITTGLK